MYPSFQTIISREGDRELFRTYRSFNSLIPLIALFLGSLLVSVALIAFLQGPLGTFLEQFSKVSPRWLAIPPALVLLEILRRRHNDLYVLGREVLSVYGGRISFNYFIHVIKYSDIRAVNVSQTFWGRILDYGTVEVATAAQQEGDIYIYGVRSPVELANIIEQFRSENQVRHASEASDKKYKNDGE